MVQLPIILLIACSIWGTSPASATDRPPTIQRRESPLCHRFDPSPMAEWKDASTPTMKCGDGMDCRNSNSPCSAAPLHPPDRVSWSIEYRAEDGNVRLDIKTFNVSAIGGSYAEEVWTDEDITLYVPAGQRGYLGAYVKAAAVKGSFGECSDGATYPGEAVVPDARGVTHAVVLF